MANGSLSSSSAAVREVADEFSATLSQTSFTISQEPSVNSKVKMSVNGIRISNTAYSVSGNTLTNNPANNAAVQSLPAVIVAEAGGALISLNVFNSAPWIGSGCGSDGFMPNPGIIWYWVR